MSDPSDRLAPGTVLDLGRRYRIERFLGAGGFAEVYAAHELGIGRPVALKLLGVGPHSRPLHKRRFFREAQAAARIGHPDVVTILEHGVAPDGRPYIAQAFLDGLDLAEALETGGPLSPGRALPLFARALDALAAAHEAGVVHRDLKPANLFLDGIGTHRERLVILDFGVAFLHEQLDDRLTATGGFLGTPRYMAPEYIEQRAVAPAMDVYQMALVLVEALCGRPVVDAANAYQSMVAHVHGQLSVPLWLDASDLGPMVRAALSRDPSARPSAAALRDGLAGLDSARLVPRVTAPVIADAETVDSGRLAVAETADSDEGGPPTLDPRWVELVDGRSAGGPPPIPYAAYLQARPATEALSLSLFAPEAEASVTAGADRTAVLAPPVAVDRRRRVGVALAIGAVALAGAWAALDRGGPRSAVVPDGADAIDAMPDDMAGIPHGSDDSDAMLDAMGGADAMPDVMPDTTAPLIGEPVVVPAPRPPPTRPPAAAAPTPAAAPAIGPSDPAKGGPTSGELMDWRKGLRIDR